MTRALKLPFSVRRHLALVPLTRVRCTPGRGCFRHSLTDGAINQHPIVHFLFTSLHFCFVVDKMKQSFFGSMKASQKWPLNYSLLKMSHIQSMQLETTGLTLNDYGYDVKHSDHFFTGPKPWMHYTPSVAIMLLSRCVVVGLLQQGIGKTSTCSPLLGGSSVGNMNVRAGTSARLWISATPKTILTQDHQDGSLPEWVGLCVPTGVRGDYSSRAWWPAESLQITETNQVNRSCLRTGRVTIPQLKPCFPYYTSAPKWPPIGSLSGPLMCNRTWSRADSPLQPCSKVIVHLADAERTLCKIAPEIRSFNLNADLLFVPFGLPLALDDIL